MVDDLKQAEVQKRLQEGRRMRKLDKGLREFQMDGNQSDSLGPLAELPGTWTSPVQGWNLIALPFKDPSAPFNYRLLMNQYGESLDFSFVDENIPNRGIDPGTDGATDQLLTGLDYQQVINQVAAEDSPSSGLLSPNGAGIHHEPGLFLHVMNKTTEDNGEKLSVARLATIPHGDSVLAMGKVTDWFGGPPTIPNVNALPIRVSQDVENNPYLAPYKHFEDTPFFGTVPPTVPGFPGFFSSNANAILQFAVERMNVKRTMVLDFDTKFATGGIVNIPFIVKEANATEMTATFWIMELETGDGEPPQFVMQYSQTVFLDFFPSKDDPSELIRWPHVSINTLTRT